MAMLLAARLSAKTVMESSHGTKRAISLAIAPNHHSRPHASSTHSIGASHQVRMLCALKN